MSKTLKPCPFCGGEAEIERYGDRSKSTIYSCGDCGCRLETGEEWGHGERWNTRAPNPQQAADIKALREALEDALAALERTVIHVHSDNVWINSRVKGSAMWQLKDANPAYMESFRESARLNAVATDSVKQTLAATDPNRVLGDDA